MTRMKLSEIKQILGGDVSKGNTKMPGTTFGLSVYGCARGGKLRDKKGSVCEGCYAKRLEDLRPSVHTGWTNRLDAVRRAIRTVDGRDLWVDAMVQRLEMMGPDHHRWHDSGDLQGLDHLIMIVRVAKRLPNIKFWLPTRERGMVQRFLAVWKCPPNLVIRVSADMVGACLDIDGLNTSMVYDAKNDDPSDIAWICPARHQGNSCGDCRACWDPGVSLVAYPKH